MTSQEIERGTMKILRLNLKKKWFDMIASGEKKEEYREMKPYWQQRLVKKGYWHSQAVKDFDIIRFRNGYKKDAPTMDVEFLGGEPADYGRKEWGGHDHQSARIFILKLGKIIPPSSNFSNGTIVNCQNKNHAVQSET
jgi:hypothetical protein